MGIMVPIAEEEKPSNVFLYHHIKYSSILL